MAAERILVVDDNSLNSKLLAYVLDVNGYETRTAADAAEALTLVESFAPRLILMDIQLPGMDGLELTRLLKRDPDRRHILIIAVTASAMKGDDVKAFEAGCDGYITKPIDARALPGLILQYLSGAPRN